MIPKAGDALAGKLEECERRFRLLDDKMRVLEKERQKLSAVLNHTDAGFLSFDPSLRVVWTNAAFRARFYTSAEGDRPLGSICNRVVCMRLGVCAECPAARCFESGSVAHHEVHLEASGKSRHVYATAVPIRSLTGEVEEAIVMLQDVSDLEVLRQSEARKGAILDTALDAILTVDHRCVITEFNRSAETIFGYAASRALGMQISELIVGTRCFASEDESVLRQRIETTGIRENRAEFPVEIVISRVPLPGPPAITVYVRDLSDRRAAEQALRASEDQLRQAQKMEAVGRLAGGIAHDFNNILTAIAGYGELMLRSVHESEPLRPNLEEILRAAHRAANLTRQLLAFSRRQVLEPKVLSLDAIVAGILPMLGRLIGEDIELAFVPTPVLGHVKADRGQIEQVLMNLAVNARDAMPDGGTLTLETRNVALDAAYARQHVPLEPGRYVMLTVRDTGIGMDAETRARVFEPFFTTKAQGRGTGLGLASVYGIVKQSGGYIWVQSEPGRGTTFEVHLPRVDEEVAAAEVAPLPDGVCGTETVLVVEDEDVVRALTSEVLEAQGYTVLKAHYGPEALKVCDLYAGEIHLMLTDLVMPQMSGRELAQRVTVLRPGIRILYMSGYAGDSMTQQGVLDEGDSYLDKPFTLTSLTRKVREVLEAPSKARR